MIAANRSALASVIDYDFKDHFHSHCRDRDSSCKCRRLALCLTAAENEHKIYMSKPFESDSSIETIENAFSRLLSQLNVRPREVQCPRSTTEQSILAMRRHAITFNQLN